MTALLPGLTASCAVKSWMAPDRLMQQMAGMVGNIALETAANGEAERLEWWMQGIRRNFLAALLLDLETRWQVNPELTFDGYLRTTLSVRALLIGITNPKREGYWL